MGWAGWEERAVASFTTQSSEELASAMRKRRIFFLNQNYCQLERWWMCGSIGISIRN